MSSNDQEEEEKHTQPRSLYVNLAVTDVDKSKDFFAKLGMGLKFNDAFSEKGKCACLMINEHASVMLLQTEFFDTFTKRPRCDSHKQVEGLFCISAHSRAEVDAVVHRAIAAGGKHTGLEPLNQPGMYGWSFLDLDGHHWEVGYMGQADAPAQPQHVGTAPQPQPCPDGPKPKLGEFVIKEVSPMPIVGVRKTVKYTELREFCSKARNGTIDFVTKHHLKFVHTMNVVFAFVEGGIDIMCAAQLVEGQDDAVAAAIKGLPAGELSFWTTTLPGGPALTNVLTGPYDQLMAAWQAMHTELKERGVKQKLPCWEIYVVNSDHEKDQSKLKTHLVHPFTE